MHNVHTWPSKVTPKWTRLKGKKTHIMWQRHRQNYQSYPKKSIRKIILIPTKWSKVWNCSTPLCGDQLRCDVLGRMRVFVACCVSHACMSCHVFMYMGGRHASVVWHYYCTRGSGCVQIDGWDGGEGRCNITLGVQIWVDRWWYEFNIAYVMWLKKIKLLLFLIILLCSWFIKYEFCEIPKSYPYKSMVNIAEWDVIRTKSKCGCSTDTCMIIIH